MFSTWEGFLQEVQRRAGLGSVEEADRIVRVVFGLVKARIPTQASEQIARLLCRGLAKTWATIAVPEDAAEVHHVSFDRDLEDEPVRPHSFFPEFIPGHG